MPRACNNNRIGGLRLPRRSQYLSGAERGLITLLDALAAKAASADTKAAKAA